MQRFYKCKTKYFVWFFLKKTTNRLESPIVLVYFIISTLFLINKRAPEVIKHHKEYWMKQNNVIQPEFGEK